MEEQEKAPIWAIFMRELPQQELKKGGFIAPEVVERVTGTARTEYAFRFRTLELRSRIEDHFQNEGITVTVKCDHDGLRILTDSEAAEYNHELFKLRMKATFTAHRKMMGLDASQLSNDQREAHDRRVIAQGRILQSVTATNIEVRLLPYKRDL